MKEIKKFFVEHEWSIIGLLILSSITLGTMGGRIYLIEKGVYYSFFDALYLGLKLFFFAFVQQQEIHWTLQIARFLAPLTLWYAAAKTFLLLAKEKMSLIKLKKLRKHTIVCGLCEMSNNFVQDLLNSGEKVVIIEQDVDNHYIQNCKDKGAIVLDGTDYDEYTLKKSGLERAKSMVCLDDDVSNIASVIVAHKLSRKLKMENNVSAYIHISKLSTLSDLNEIDFFSEIQRDYHNRGGKKHFEILPFNLHERAARIIYSKFSPDAFQAVRVDSPQPHIVIIGFNQMGKALLVQVARMSHYANQKKIRVSILDKGVNALKRLFLKSYPQIHNVVDLHFHELNIDSFSINDFVKIQSDIPVVASYLCLDEDKFSVNYIRLIIPLIHEKSNKLVICMKNSDNVFSVMPRKYQKQIYSFLLFEETCTKKAIFNETIDDLAKAIHNDYISKQMQAGTFSPETKASHQEWNMLSQNFKDQNKSQADNFMVKVRAIGAKLAPLKTPIPEYRFTDNKEMVELLAMMEHHRWCAHLWVNGWQYGDKRDDANKIHTDLMPYDQLTDQIKQYDRDAILNLPDLLRSLGKKIVKDN